MLETFAHLILEISFKIAISMNENVLNKQQAAFT